MAIFFHWDLVGLTGIAAYFLENMHGLNGGWWDECEAGEAVNRIGFGTRWCGIDHEFVGRSVHPFCLSFSDCYSMDVNLGVHCELNI